MRHSHLLMGALLIAAPLSFVLAQQDSVPATVPNSNERARLQRLFDEANRNFEARNWAAAAEGFSRFRQEGAGRDKRATAIAAVREGHALVQLNKREAASEVLEAGLENFPADEILRSDRIRGFQDLAFAYERGDMIALAARAYARLIPLLQRGDPAKLNAEIGYIRAVMFYDPPAAIAAADRALREVNGQGRATLLILRGRAELISGRNKEAIANLQEALALAGGITARTDPLDARVRSDLGIAYLISGNEKAAHALLGAAGTARMPGSVLQPPITVNVLGCRDDQTPQDFAILELSVGTDGVPRDVWPIYATRLGAFAQSLAGVVRMMRWSPESAQKLRPLFAQTIRLEAHCETAEFDTSVLRGASPLRRMASPNYREQPSLSVIDTEDELRAARLELTRMEQQFGQNSSKLLPLLQLLADSPLVDSLETGRIWDRSLAIAAEAKLPPAVIADIEYRRNGLVDTVAESARIETLLRDPKFSSDPEARGFLTLHRAWTQLLAPGADEIEPVQRVAEDAALPADHPVRKAANFILYFLDRRARGTSKRTDYLRKAGLSSIPCSSFILQSSKTPSSSFYPKEAARWGMEGWIQISASLNNNGKVVAMQPAYAYPPLIFTPAAREVSGALAFRVRSDLKPVNGCSGYQRLLHFRLR